MGKGEFTNKHITEKFDHLILDSSLSDDFYWGSSGTIEVSVGAIPGGVTQSQLNAAIAKADASISRIDTSVGALDTLTQNLDTSIATLDTLTVNSDASISALDTLTQNLDTSIATLDTLTVNSDASISALDTLTQNLDTSLGAFGQNITVSPSENASYNNGSYMCVDSSLYFKANDFWLVIDASLMF